jgi:hypothetical protein
MDPSKVVTAGAFVLGQRRIPFVVGPTPDHIGVAVIRLGGHREEGETPWECVCLHSSRCHIGSRSPVECEIIFQSQRRSHETS